MAKKVAHIGEMDRRIELIKYVGDKNEHGEKQHQEESLGNVWAKLEDVSGTEEIEGQVISLAYRRYVIRWRQDVVQDGVLFYVKDEDGEFNIHHVEHQGRKEYTILKTFKRE